MSTQLLFIILAILAGAMIPFQSAMNANLGKALQSPYYSALSVFTIAAIGTASYILITRSATPALAQFGAAPWWSYLGGIIGGCYILLIIICAPKLGIGTTTVMVLMGQVLAAMLIDQFGLLGNSVHAINWQRVIGVLLIVGGVYLVKKY